MTSKKIPTFLDAFAGCGGLSLGLMQAGLRGRFAIEHDAFAFSTLKRNLLSKNSKYKYSWPKWLPKDAISITSFLTKYATEVESLQGTIDIVVGGPPCQGFSAAGRRKIDDPRNKLFSTYLRLVNKVRPKIVLIENVRGFSIDFSSTSECINYSDELRKKLAANYTVHERLLDLRIFGVPQARTRYFVIATRNDLSLADPFELLEARLPAFLKNLGISAPVSSQDAISDLESRKGGTRPSKECPGFQETRPSGAKSQYQKLMNGGRSFPSDLRLARHNPEIVSRFQKIIEMSHAQGRLNVSIGADIREMFGIKKAALRVLDPNKPSPTITSMPDDLLHYSEPRTLTVRENARLQSFPDWYSFQGKYTTGGHLRRKEVPRFTQVANAVPPLAARAIGEVLIELLQPCQEKSPSVKNRNRIKQIPEVLA